MFFLFIKTGAGIPAYTVPFSLIECVDLTESVADINTISLENAARAIELRETSNHNISRGRERGREGRKDKKERQRERGREGGREKRETEREREVEGERQRQRENQIKKERTDGQTIK